MLHSTAILQNFTVAKTGYGMTYLHELCYLPVCSGANGQSEGPVSVRAGVWTISRSDLDELSDLPNQSL